jgi:hypothetical protein
MLTIRTAAHIHGANNLRGFRSCPASTGAPMPGLDTSRLLRSERGRSTNEARRCWLARQWEAHEMRARARYVAHMLSCCR